MSKYSDALERIARARAGHEKNLVLWEVMQDEEIREALRIAIDPNEQVAVKPGQLKGVGVSILNRAQAGLAKDLHIASPIAVVSEIDPKLWELVAPQEEWAMCAFPAGMRALLCRDGTVRSSRGFVTKLNRGYGKTLDGVLTLDRIRTPLDFYERIKKQDLSGAKFMAFDVADGTIPFTERRKYIEGTGIECLPVRSSINAGPAFANWRKLKYTGAVFRKLDLPYVTGIDRGLVICQFAKIIQGSLGKRVSKKVNDKERQND